MKLITEQGYLFIATAERETIWDPNAKPVVFLVWLTTQSS